MTLAAVVGILLAAALYTTATFAERRARILKASHLRLFWSGFVVDVIATTLMTMISGGFSLNLHGVLGVGAILVMLGHSSWATVVLALKQAKLMRQFHTFSLAVWALWMITLVTGFALALPRVIAKGKGKAQAELLGPARPGEALPGRFPFCKEPYSAVGADAVGEFCLGSAGDVPLHLLPVPLIVPDFLAGGTNRQQSIQHSNAGVGLLQLAV